MPGITFDQKRDLEMLRLEKLRARILVGIFLLGVLVQFIIYLSVGSAARHNPVARNVFFVSFSFNLFAVIYGILHLTYLNVIPKKRKFHLTTGGKVIHTTIEALYPTVLIYVVAVNFSNPSKIIVDSPSFYLYYLLIILSTLRLNFFLSVWAAFVSAAGYFILGFLLIDRDSASANNAGSAIDFSIITKCVWLLLNGVVAGFISVQVRKSITRMVKAVEEEDKIMNLFSQQTSKEVVNEILANVVNKEESKLMHVCVMFVDIRNFTSMMGRQSAEHILQYQNTFFSTVIQVVYKNKGIINQFLGDGCMVTFGAPQALDNPSEAAVKSAYEIKEAVEQKVQEGLLPATTIGIGMHAGDAVTGNVGNEVRQQFSITGSVVILAARIEQLNKEFGSHILASEEVIQQARVNNLEPLPLGSFTLKGWDYPLNIYKLA